MDFSETIKLWDKTPGEHTYEPEMTYYPAPVKISKATVVIFPGGGYCSWSFHEGYGYAQYLNSLGIDVFVVKYRLNPYRFPLPLLDARRAVRYVRANAEKYDIDPSRVAVMGSSAGGHLAALVSTYRGEIEYEGIDATDGYDYLPNAQILCYPVICMDDDRITHMGSNEGLLGDNRSLAPSVTPSTIADEKTPQAFFWHTSDDSAVNVINTYRYATKLRELNIPAEVIVYPSGHHGEGLAPGFLLNSSWTQELFKWLCHIGFITEQSNDTLKELYLSSWAKTNHT